MRMRKRNAMQRRRRKKYAHINRQTVVLIYFQFIDNTTYTPFFFFLIPHFFHLSINIFMLIVLFSVSLWFVHSLLLIVCHEQKKKNKIMLSPKSVKEMAIDNPHSKNTAQIFLSIITVLTQASKKK